MKEFILDTSVVAAWFRKSQSNDYTDSVLECLGTDQYRAIVPGLMFLEITDVVLNMERRKLATRADSTHFLRELRKLRIAQAELHSDQVFDSVLSVARDYALSAYHATCLEVAARLGLPLATVDKHLVESAEQAGVTRFRPGNANGSAEHVKPTS